MFLQIPNTLDTRAWSKYDQTRWKWTNVQHSLYHSCSKSIASKVKKGGMAKTNKQQKRATFTLN